MNELLKIGILTVSDRAHRGEYEDRGGPALRELLSLYVSSGWELDYRVVPDERGEVEGALKEMADKSGCSLIVTTGGTGPAPRDVTVDATVAVIEKELPGFGEAMRAVSLKKVPTAVLSRQTAGVRGSSLIINLPGSPKAISECLEAVFPAVPDCLDLIGGHYMETNPEHVRTFRPHSHKGGGHSHGHSHDDKDD